MKKFYALLVAAVAVAGFAPQTFAATYDAEMVNLSRDDTVIVIEDDPYYDDDVVIIEDDRYRGDDVVIVEDDGYRDDEVVIVED